MTPGRRTRIKVCCIADPHEARLAIDAGADALGLVAQMPSGPGTIPDDQIRHIALGVAPPVATFLLTSRTDPQGVLDHVRRCATGVVQLVDRVHPDTYPLLREGNPALKIVQVIHVQGEPSVAEAVEIAPVVDGVLLDSGRPDGAVKTLGGTGQTHDWRTSAQIVSQIDKPVFLAGGLREDNVGEAIATVRPFGVDLCSGVRTGGRLDGGKLARFVAAVQGARSPSREGPSIDGDDVSSGGPK